MISERDPQKHLVVGWKVDHAMDPKYWLQPDPRPGLQPPSDLVCIPPNLAVTHTAIIAQSGSGKSVLLGRILEELMLKTRVRCVVLDPNADFRRVDHIEPASLWERARYNILNRRGRLPHERSREEFADRWEKISIMIRRRGADGGHATHQPLKLWWPLLSMEFLTGDDLEPKFRSDLYHLHSFVYAMGLLAEAKSDVEGKTIDLFHLARVLFSQARALEKEDFSRVVEREFEVVKDHEDKLPFWWSYDQLKEVLMSSPEFVDPNVERYYFGKIGEIKATGILSTEAVTGQAQSRISNRRLEVVDLPSIKDKATRLLAINALVTTEWEQAREDWNKALEAEEKDDIRVPTVLVVDEAHNLIPDEPRSHAERALREQFRTLVAEGRKYGLFVMLVTQRPDKLDHMILSECENKAIMRLGSAAVLRITRERLGLDDVSAKTLEKSLEFGPGRALLMGKWAPEGPKYIYCAPRRTLEGGRNLREEHWASSEFSDRPATMLGSRIAQVPDEQPLPPVEPITVPNALPPEAKN